MKNKQHRCAANVTIRMGAAHNDVTVKGADGKPVTFDRNAMTKDENRNFHREFMNAFRSTDWSHA